jgi:hypothetical protein
LAAEASSIRATCRSCSAPRRLFVRLLRTFDCRDLHRSSPRECVASLLTSSSRPSVTLPTRRYALQTPCFWFHKGTLQCPNLLGRLTLSCRPSLAAAFLRAAVVPSLPCRVLAPALAQGTSFEEVAARVLQAGGPVATATKADAVRLHDDRWGEGPQMCCQPSSRAMAAISSTELRSG